MFCVNKNAYISELNVENMQLKLIVCALLVGSICLFAGCIDQKSLKEFIIVNPTALTRVDEPVVLDRTRLRPVNSNLCPITVTEEGNPLPCQLDDLDGDGTWDELAFVCSLAPNERRLIRINWVAPADYPMFPRRTNIRYGKMDEKGVVKELSNDSHGRYHLPRGAYGYPYQMDGPAWENDKIGFRLYFDGRNCYDVFGKRTAEMVLDTVGIHPDGYPVNSYQTLREWGGDILSVANSFGLGGLALQTPDSLVRMGVTFAQDTDVVDSTFYHLVTEGPVRSIFRMHYKGWQVGEASINVDEEICIWAGKQGYGKRIKTSLLPASTSLVTGIVSNLNTQPFVEREYEKRLLGLMTHDRQTVNCNASLGMGIIVPCDNVVAVFHAPEDGMADIRKTWCVSMKPDADGGYSYYVYAACELGDKRFRDRQEFLSMMDREAERLNHPVVVEE